MVCAGHTSCFYMPSLIMMVCLLPRVCHNQGPNSNRNVKCHTISLYASRGGLWRGGVRVKMVNFLGGP